MSKKEVIKKEDAKVVAVLKKKAKKKATKKKVVSDSDTKVVTPPEPAGISLVCEYRMAMRAQGDYELQARVGVTDAWTVLDVVRSEEEARFKISLIKKPFIQL